MATEMNLIFEPNNGAADLREWTQPCNRLRCEGRAEYIPSIFTNVNAHVQLNVLYLQVELVVVSTVLGLYVYLPFRHFQRSVISLSCSIGDKSCGNSELRLSQQNLLSVYSRPLFYIFFLFNFLSISDYINIPFSFSISLIYIPMQLFIYITFLFLIFSIMPFLEHAFPPSFHSPFFLSRPPPFHLSFPFSPHPLKLPDTNMQVCISSHALPCAQ